MKNLNKYIFEKLKINKNTKLDKDLVHKGDIVLVILHHYYHRRFEISLSYYIVIDCDSNKLRCKRDGGSLIHEYNLSDVYKSEKELNGLDKVFAYKAGAAKKGEFEYILLKDEAIEFLKEAVKSKDKNISIPEFKNKFENVIYKDDYQYQAKDLLKIFESD